MKLVSKALVIGALLASAGAHASSSSAGYVTNILPYGNGLVLFDQGGQRTDTASCQTSSVPNRWVFNSATPAGQAQFATILTAYALHKEIVVYGTTACDAWTGVESLSFLITSD